MREATRAEGREEGREEGIGSMLALAVGSELGSGLVSTLTLNVSEEKEVGVGFGAAVVPVNCAVERMDAMTEEAPAPVPPSTAWESTISKEMVSHCGPSSLPDEVSYRTRWKEEPWSRLTVSLPPKLDGSGDLSPVRVVRLVVERGG